MRILAAPCLLLAAAAAPAVAAPPTTTAPQVQIDGGLSVIGAGYEHPVTDRVSVMAMATVVGTYFLPWFDLGDRVVGFGGGLRVTWFARDDGRGFYVAPYARAAVASGEHEGIEGDGNAITGGVFAGWTFGLSDRLDLRVGGGVQYIYIDGDNGLGASTPFVAIDALLGYRL